VLKHLCAVAQSFLKEKVRGNAERLKYWEMSRSRKNGLGFAKQFCGREDSQNRDKMFLKFGEIRVSAPQEGAGGMRGGHFGFWRKLGMLTK